MCSLHLQIDPSKINVYLKKNNYNTKNAKKKKKKEKKMMIS